MTMIDQHPVCGWLEPPEGDEDLQVCSTLARWRLTHIDQGDVTGLVCDAHRAAAEAEGPWAIEPLNITAVTELAARGEHWVAFCSCGWVSQPRRFALTAEADAWLHLPMPPNPPALGRVPASTVAAVRAMAHSFGEEHRSSEILAPDPDVVLSAARARLEDDIDRAAVIDLSAPEHAALRQLAWSSYWTARGSDATPSRVGEL